MVKKRCSLAPRRKRRKNHVAFLGLDEFLIWSFFFILFFFLWVFLFFFCQFSSIYAFYTLFGEKKKHKLKKVNMKKKEIKDETTLLQECFFLIFFGRSSLTFYLTRNIHKIFSYTYIYYLFSFMMVENGVPTPQDQTNSLYNAK